MRAIASKVHCKWTADANQQLAEQEVKNMEFFNVNFGGLRK